jgi:hypothetical protein
MTAASSRSLLGRVGALTAATLFLATATLFFPAQPAAAAPDLQGQCSVQQWQDPGSFQDCVGKLQDLTTSEAQCVMAPTPEAPDSGMAGWFATKPAAADSVGPRGKFTTYGYAGYDYTTYDIGCVPTVMHPDYKFENTVANGEFMIATGIIGASNALREKAWSPQSLWGWADTLVDKATRSIYDRVFTVFGALTLAVIGLYLLWRSRQSDMSNAMTTAGWAILVMVAVTAIAAWPVRAAHLADDSLITGLDAVHGAVGPVSATTPADQCRENDPALCIDQRPPAIIASDTAVDTMLYRNWLRGELGSADSVTAQKYGPVLYDSKSLSWADEEKIKQNPDTREKIIAAKQTDWEKVAKQIKTEDPEAYQYLQGTQGMDRIGAGFIAILSAVFFSMFDIVASILVLLGFLIFRWAVVAAPVLGTVGMLRPASTGIRRLANAVIAAIFNIIIFGTGASIYLFAVDLIMNTTSLPGWLQVTLVWLCGVVGWLLLRPYRRITQLGGKSSAAEIATAGTWHRRFFRDLRQAATLAVATPAVESVIERHTNRPLGIPAPGTVRPEARNEDTPAAARENATRGTAATRTEDRSVPEEATPAARPPRRQVPAADTYLDAGNEEPPMYVVYRPSSTRTSGPQPNTTSRPESAPVRG